ncbi:MAG: ATPase [Bacillota bacterium]|nr:ATPase [Bacillota bacterium]
MDVVAWKALFAAVSIFGSALATSWAQAKIGSAGAGAIAEKPEVAGMIIALEALPELMVVLGFVVAAMIITVL